MCVVNAHVKAYSPGAKAKIFFDVWIFFFDLFRLFFDPFRFHSVWMSLKYWLVTIREKVKNRSAKVDSREILVLPHTRFIN